MKYFPSAYLYIHARPCQMPNEKSRQDKDNLAGRTRTLTVGRQDRE
jgi:hypothetical protein